MHTMAKTNIKLWIDVSRKKIMKIRQREDVTGHPEGS
jgi:hypothetical protein